MAVRINKAKNFKGKAYVAADELDSLIQTLTFAPTAQSITSDATWLVNFTTADGGNTDTSAVDLTAIKSYIDNKAIDVVAGNGITINASDPLAPVISTNLKITKVNTETGYAASYKLQYLSDATNNTYADVTGDTINIVKDQFIKSATFGWSTADDSTGAGWTTTKSTTAKYPCIKIEVYVNENGVSNDDTLVQSLYIPLADTFQEYTAQNGVTITDDSIIEGVVDTATSEQVYTAKNSSAAVLSVGTSGFKVANIQAAIDNAVTAEHNAASAAIEDLEGDVLAFASNTSNAVTALNTRIVAVASNAETAAGNAQANAIAYASGVADNAQSAATQLFTFISQVNDDFGEYVETQLQQTLESVGSGAINSANVAISANIDNVNTTISGAVASVNAMVSGSVDNVNAKVTSLADTVSATVETVSGAMESLAGDVNDAVTARNTQLANAVEIIDSEVTLANGSTTGEKTATVTAKYVVAVYGADYGQIYPEIVRNSSAGTYTLTADYGENETVDSAWHVLCARDLPAYTGSAVAVTGYSNTVAYTNASKAADATYSPVTKVAANALEGFTLRYDGFIDADGVTVDKGTAGTSATTVATGTAATAPATDGIAVEKAEPDYKPAP